MFYLYIQGETSKPDFKGNALIEACITCTHTVFPRKNAAKVQATFSRKDDAFISYNRDNINKKRKWEVQKYIYSLQ